MDEDMKLFAKLGLNPMTPFKPYYGMYSLSEMTPPASINDPMENSPYINANGRRKMPEYADKEKIKYMISNYYGIIPYSFDDFFPKRNR